MRRLLLILVLLLSPLAAHAAEGPITIHPHTYFLPRSPVELNSVQLWTLILAERKAGKDTRPKEVVYHQKFSLPLATLFVTLLAAPLALIFSSGGAFMGGTLAIGLVFLYFTIMSVCQSLGSYGFISPVLAAWMPNLVCAAFGLALLRRLNRH